MNQDRSDKELVEAYVSERNPEVFGEIVSRHADRVFSLCIRMTGNRQDALDASQEVFLRLLRKIDLYDGSAAFSTWLHRVATNVCYDQLRARARRATPLDDPPEMVDLTPLRDLDAAELRPLVEEALSLLPHDYRVPVVLRDMEGYSYEQIEKALGIPGGTVRSRLHRGRRILANYLRNLLEEEERHSDEGSDTSDTESEFEPIGKSEADQ